MENGVQIDQKALGEVLRAYKAVLGIFWDPIPVTHKRGAQSRQKRRIVGHPEDQGWRLRPGRVPGANLQGSHQIRRSEILYWELHARDTLPLNHWPGPKIHNPVLPSNRDQFRAKYPRPTGNRFFRGLLGHADLIPLQAPDTNNSSWK